MPDIRDPLVVERIAERFTVDLNKPQTLIDVGYTVSYARTTKGLQLYERPEVKSAISKLQEEFREIMAGSREKSARDYNDMLLLAKEQKQPAAGVSAIRWRDGLFGLQSLDNSRSDAVQIIINPPKEVKSVINVESEDVE